MGLAEQKNKQRIGLDPQNLTWSKDQSRFGFKMLNKMGWKEGQGLGANKDGIATHVKVSLRANQLGLGAEKNTSENWLENTSGFSAVLAKLNSNTATPVISDNEEASDKPGKKEKKEKKEKKDKKKKRENEEDVEESSKKSKKDKKEKKEKKDKKDKKSKKEKKELKEKEADKPAPTKPVFMTFVKSGVAQSEFNNATKLTFSALSESESAVSTPISSSNEEAGSSRLHHRAKFLKSKRMSTSNPADMRSILGI